MEYDSDEYGNDGKHWLWCVARDIFTDTTGCRGGASRVSGATVVDRIGDIGAAAIANALKVNTTMADVTLFCA